MNFLRKNVYKYKEHDNNCNNFNGGFYGVVVEKVKHRMVILVSGCKIG